MDPPGPIGAKIIGAVCDFDPEPESLPIVTIDVHRQFEECIASDRRRHLSSEKAEDMSANELYTFLRTRAGDLGACVAGKMACLTLHEPVVSLSFTELIEEKEEIVPKIAEALGLEPTEEQLQTAINFLDKDKKHS